MNLTKGEKSFDNNGTLSKERNLMSFEDYTIEKQFDTYSYYSTPRGKTDKFEEPVSRELNITRS